MLLGGRGSWLTFGQMSNHEKSLYNSFEPRELRTGGTTQHSLFMQERIGIFSDIRIARSLAVSRLRVALISAY